MDQSIIYLFRREIYKLNPLSKLKSIALFTPFAHTELENVISLPLRILIGIRLNKKSKVKSLKINFDINKI